MPALSNSRKRSTDDTGKGASDNVTGSAVFLTGAAITAFLFLANPVMSPFEFYHLINNAVLLWIPLMVILLFLKQEPSEFGLTAGERKWGYSWTLIAIPFIVVALYFVSKRPEFQNYYGNTLSQPLAFGHYALVKFNKPELNIQGFLYYEAIMCMYFFCWEFFFRGYLLFGLAKFRFLGPWGAVFVQALPFTLLHWSLNPAAAKPPLEIASAFVGGLFLGALAVRTKSFFYGFLIHWCLALGLDLFFVAPYLLHPNG